MVEKLAFIEEDKEDIAPTIRQIRTIEKILDLDEEPFSHSIKFNASSKLNISTKLHHSSKISHPREEEKEEKEESKIF